MKKRNTILNLMIVVAVILTSCGVDNKEPQSEEEALSWIKNTVWEEKTDLSDMHLQEVDGTRITTASTFYFFSNDGYCYINPRQEMRNNGQGLPYKINFEKGEPHNAVQVCINSCDNPTVYYIASKTLISSIQFPSMETSSLKKVE
jgi:hypothetical protein